MCGRAGKDMAKDDQRNGVVYEGQIPVGSKSAHSALVVLDTMIIIVIMVLCEPLMICLTGNGFKSN